MLQKATARIVRYFISQFLVPPFPHFSFLPANVKWPARERFRSLDTTPVSNQSITRRTKPLYIDGRRKRSGNGRTMATLERSRQSPDLEKLGLLSKPQNDWAKLTCSPYSC